jgi:hypothetical protein
VRTRTALLSTPLVAALALLPACGGGDDGSDLEAAEVGTAPEDTAEPFDDPAAAGTVGTPDQAGAEADDAADDGVEDADQPADQPGADAAGQRPARDECVTLPEAPDGLYQVADVGTVTVTVDGDRLVLGTVTPAEGWEAEEVEEERDEIEVEFRAPGEDEIDFEAELDDGRLQVKVCNDDD